MSYRILTILLLCSTFFLSAGTPEKKHNPASKKFEELTRYRTMSILRQELEKISLNNNGIDPPIYFTMAYNLRGFFKRNIVRLEAFHYSRQNAPMDIIPVTQHHEGLDSLFSVDMKLNSFVMTRANLKVLLDKYPTAREFFFVPTRYDERSVKYVIALPAADKQFRLNDFERTEFYLNPSPPAPPRFSDN